MFDKFEGFWTAIFHSIEVQLILFGRASGNGGLAV